MKEFHRILKKGGILELAVPHYTNAGAFSNQHYRFFSTKTFRDYLKGSKYNNHYDFGFSSIKFKLTYAGRLCLLWNLPVFLIANINVAQLYEQTPLSLFPAISLEVTIVK